MIGRGAARTSAAARSGGSDVVESVADAGDRFGGPARDGLGWHGLGAAAAADRQSAAPAFRLPAATAVELSATPAGLSLSAAAQLPPPAAAGISLLAAADGRTAAAAGLCQARLLYP